MFDLRYEAVKTKYTATMLAVIDKLILYNLDNKID